MKKIVILVLTLALSISIFVGCSAKPSTELPEQNQQEDVAENNGKTNQGNTANQEIAPDEAPGGEMMFGKVKNIVGNEIELELANPPFNAEQESANGGGGSGEQPNIQYNVESEVSGENETFVGEGEGGEQTVMIAGEDGTAHVIGGDSGQKMELEYTGESKSVVIPAGIDITNLVGGNSTLESIKKGSVLMLTVDESTGKLTATSVMVME